jgi:hypothetical protein
LAFADGIAWGGQHLLDGMQVAWIIAGSAFSRSACLSLRRQPSRPGTCCARTATLIKQVTGFQRALGGAAMLPGRYPCLAGYLILANRLAKGAIC